MSIKATIIKDSINSETNDRLTTFVLVFPRIVLAEFNTHKIITRNSASSRAIKYEKMLEMVLKNPFIPISFQEKHSGMQGSKNLEGFRFFLARFFWLRARDLAVISSFILNKIGVTKQICNRILEPFMWHTVIATGTEWENFFKLRAHKDAEIHIQKLAYLMLEEYNKSVPEIKRVVEFNYVPHSFSLNEFMQQNPNLDWHIPYEDKMPENINNFDKLKIATSRCARISYLTQDGKIDKEKDYELFDRLMRGGHLSPLEHLGFPMKESKFSGNLKGWFQFRKLIPNENAKDSRVVKKIVVDNKVV